MIWMSGNDFRVSTCKGVKAYIKHETGVDVEVHKTTRYLVVTYITGDQLKQGKIDLPGGVLYTLGANDFVQVIEDIKRTKTDL